MKQKKTINGTEQVVEEFEPYKPICLANIYGMEEVLGDRCIPLIIDKSSRLDIMKLLEDFKDNYTIKKITTLISEGSVVWCSYFAVQKGIQNWNIYVKNKYRYIYTLTTLTTQTTETTQEKYLEMFNKIDATCINGRNLELFFPLMYISRFISEDAFDSLLLIASNLNKEKRKEEMIESKDVSLIEFVSKLPITEDISNYRSMKLITEAFRNYVGNLEEKNDEWLNEKWIGRSLKRLGLIVDKRRMAYGVEITLDINKAKKNMEMFK
jgi:hypothetical protein